MVVGISIPTLDSMENGYESIIGDRSVQAFEGGGEIPTKHHLACRLQIIRFVCQYRGPKSKIAEELL